MLDTSNFFAIQKPTTNEGKHIYNAGFEAIAPIKNSMGAFFEYNYLTDHHLVIYVNDWSFKKGEC